MRLVCSWNRSLSSGVTYAIYIVLLGKFGTGRLAPYAFSFFAVLGSSAVMLVACLASGQLMLPRTLGGWLLSILFAAAINGGALVLFQRGIVIVGGQRASVLSTFEPLTSILMGCLIFHDPFGWRSLIGVVLVLGATVMIALFGKGKEVDEAKDAASEEEKRSADSPLQ